MRTIAAIALSLFVRTSWSCTCLGTSSIEESMAESPFLVEARLVSLEQVDIPELGTLILSATLRVVLVLKGSVASKAVTVEGSMCYATLFPDEMKKGRTYVLPLTKRSDGRYALRDCAHSGMELIDGKLYTFEEGSGKNKRMQFFANHADFLRRYDR